MRGVATSLRVHPPDSGGRVATLCPAEEKVGLRELDKTGAAVTKEVGRWGQAVVLPTALHPRPIPSSPVKQSSGPQTFL